MKRFIGRGLCLFALASFVFAGCASNPGAHSGDEPATAATAASTEADNDNDPFEGFNRAMYRFNEKADRYVLKPVAKGYRAAVPAPVRKGVSNFFSNLREPTAAFNALLQGKVGQAGSSLGRFLMNSTFGIFGLFDVATGAGLERHVEDFGQTLAVWGIGEGPFLVLPLFGPSTVRDGAGLVMDYVTYPPSHMEETSTSSKLFAVESIDTRARLLDASDILEQAAGQDPYVFVREAYRQRRLNQIHDGDRPAEAADPSLFEDDKPVPKDSGTDGERAPPPAP